MANTMNSIASPQAAFLGHCNLAAVTACTTRGPTATANLAAANIVIGLAANANADQKVSKIAIKADEPWQGRLIFDVPRHKTIMHMPVDWPRINQFPEWWTVKADKDYTVHEPTSQSPKTYTGQQLHEGIPIDLQPATAKYLSVHRPEN